MSTPVHVACPLCNATNRLPHEKLSSGGTCGKCGSPLFNHRPMQLTSTNFDRVIKNNGIPVLVDFWAPWCGPCKMMAPDFEKAAQHLEPYVRLGKVNTENEPSIGGRYNIRSIPTLILFQDGKPVAQQSGAMNLQGITQWVNAQLRQSTS